MDEKIKKLESDINGLKKLLDDTDYKTLKYIDGAISESEYREVKQHRAQLRSEINALQDQLNLLLEIKESNK